MAKRNYVYDIETYPNMFCAIFKSGSIKHTFEISERRNDYLKFIQFYSTEYIKYAIGFNNVRFDAQVLEHMIEDYEDLKTRNSEFLTNYIYKKAQSIISKSNIGEFLPFFETKLSVPQIDIYLMLGYNGKARATSLKWAEFSMNYPKVQDLPYKFNIPLELTQIQEVIDYCLNDVSATERFVIENNKIVKLRLKQQEQHPNLNLLNKSDSSVGELLFLEAMADEMQISMRDLKKMQTKRGSLPIKDLILPYIKFDKPEFKLALSNFKNAMSGGYNQMIVVDELEYYLGEGGIHASRVNEIYESNDEFIIKDLDVNV